MTDNQTVTERIKEFAKSKGLSVRGFEIRCGFANGWCNAIKEQIRLSAISQILLNFPDLNLNWLLAGRGEMTIRDIVGVCNDAAPSIPTHDIHNNNVVIIGNWAELGEIVEKAVNKAMEDKK